MPPGGTPHTAGVRGWRAGTALSAPQSTPLPGLPVCFHRSISCSVRNLPARLGRSGQLQMPRGACARSIRRAPRRSTRRCLSARPLRAGRGARGEGWNPRARSGAPRPVLSQAAYQSLWHPSGVDGAVRFPCRWVPGLAVTAHVGALGSQGSHVSGCAWRQRANFSMASGVTGVKKLTRLPSGSRKSSVRLPQGIVVGSLTKSVTKPVRFW